MKHKIFFTLSTILLLVFCSGCGNKPLDSDNKPNLSKPVSGETADESKEDKDNPKANVEDKDNLKANNENKDNPAVNNPETFGELLERSKLNGAVLEFSDNGCTISPAIQEGDVAYEAAPGSESLMEQVTVTYDESCTFQIVQVSISTGSMTYEDAAISDIKKQTGLIVVGEYDGEGILHAAEVYLYRMME